MATQRSVDSQFEKGIRSIRASYGISHQKEKVEYACTGGGETRGDLRRARDVTPRNRRSEPERSRKHPNRSERTKRTKPTGQPTSASRFLHPQTPLAKSFQ